MYLENCWPLVGGLFRLYFPFFSFLATFGMMIWYKRDLFCSVSFTKILLHFEMVSLSLMNLQLIWLTRCICVLKTNQKFKKKTHSFYLPRLFSRRRIRNNLNVPNLSTMNLLIPFRSINWLLVFVFNFKEMRKLNEILCTLHIAFLFDF